MPAREVSRYIDLNNTADSWCPCCKGTCVNLNNIRVELSVKGQAQFYVPFRAPSIGGTSPEMLDDTSVDYRDDASEKNYKIYKPPRYRTLTDVTVLDRSARIYGTETTNTKTTYGELFPDGLPEYDSTEITLYTYKFTQTTKLGDDLFRERRIEKIIKRKFDEDLNRWIDDDEIIEDYEWRAPDVSYSGGGGSGNSRRCLTLWNSTQRNTEWGRHKKSETLSDPDDSYSQKIEEIFQNFRARKQQEFNEMANNGAIDINKLKTSGLVGGLGGISFNASVSFSGQLNSFYKVTGFATGRWPLCIGDNQSEMAYSYFFNDQRYELQSSRLYFVLDTEKQIKADCFVKHGYIVKNNSSNVNEQVIKQDEITAELPSFSNVEQARIKDLQKIYKYPASGSVAIYNRSLLIGYVDKNRYFDSWTGDLSFPTQADIDYPKYNRSYSEDESEDVTNRYIQENKYYIANVSGFNCTFIDSYFLRYNGRLCLVEYTNNNYNSRQILTRNMNIDKKTLFYFSKNGYYAKYNFNKDEYTLYKNGNLIAKGRQGAGSQYYRYPDFYDMDNEEITYRLQRCNFF